MTKTTPFYGWWRLRRGTLDKPFAVDVVWPLSIVYPCGGTRLKLVARLSWGSLPARIVSVQARGDSTLISGKEGTRQPRSNIPTLRSFFVVNASGPYLPAFPPAPLACYLRRRRSIRVMTNRRATQPLRCACPHQHHHGVCHRSRCG